VPVQKAKISWRFLLGTGILFVMNELLSKESEIYELANVSFEEIFTETETETETE